MRCTCSGERTACHSASDFWLLMLAAAAVGRGPRFAEEMGAGKLLGELELNHEDQKGIGVLLKTSGDVGNCLIERRRWRIRGEKWRSIACPTMASGCVMLSSLGVCASRKLRRRRFG